MRINIQTILLWSYCLSAPNLPFSTVQNIYFLCHLGVGCWKGAIQTRDGRKDTFLPILFSFYCGWNSATLTHSGCSTWFQSAALPPPSATASHTLSETPAMCNGALFSEVCGTLRLLGFNNSDLFLFASAIGEILQSYFIFPSSLSLFSSP